MIRLGKDEKAFIGDNTSKLRMVQLGSTLKSILQPEQKETQMTAASTKKARPLRNQIAMDDEMEIKYWTKHFDVTREELQRAVDKVGNSAAAVRKELEVREELK